MDTREKAIELREMYLRWMDNLGYKNWKELCKGEGLTSYEEQKKWLTEDIESYWRVNNEMDTHFLEEQLESELFWDDERFSGFSLQLCRDIALAYRSSDWCEEHKLQILEELVEECNRESDEDNMISLHEYVRIESDNDPGFFSWLFDGNAALVEDGHPTELGQEIFNEFLQGL